MTMLDNCRWVPRWASHMGCIKGCLDHLGVEISDAWLYGGTGHAFVINMHEGVCPSGPTAWKTEKLFELGPNLGYRLDGVFGFKTQDDFGAVQQRAWDLVRDAIAKGRPCYGWELEVPEFYVIFGTDDVGYHYSGPGCDGGRGPKPWRELGDTGIGVLELYSVAPVEPADDVTTVREALAFALAHAANPEDWIFERYRSGLAGFDSWVHALQDGAASDMGTRYNAGVWSECRRFAAGFLEEAADRLPVGAEAVLGEAAGHYRDVASHLGTVAGLYPWSDGVSDEDLLPVDETSTAAVEALQSARASEAAGLEALERVLRAL